MEQRPIPLNMAAYPELMAAKKMKLVRLQTDHYQLAVRKYDPSNGQPAAPEIIGLNRDGVKSMADGIDKDVAALEEQIASLKKSKENLLGALLSDMDALDAQALKDGDI